MSFDWSSTKLSTWKTSWQAKKTLLVIDILDAEAMWKNECLLSIMLTNEAIAVCPCVCQVCACGRPFETCFEKL